MSHLYLPINLGFYTSVCLLNASHGLGRPPSICPQNSVAVPAVKTNPLPVAVGEVRAVFRVDIVAPHGNRMSNGDSQGASETA